MCLQLGGGAVHWFLIYLNHNKPIYPGPYPDEMEIIELP